MVFARHRIEPNTIFLTRGQGNGRGNVVLGEIGDEVMMAHAVAAANHLQSELLSEKLWLGGLCHCFGVVALDNLGSLRLEVGDMLDYVAGHDVIARDDKTLVAGAGSGLYHAILKGTRAQVFVADIVAVESGLVDVEDGLDEFRGLLGHRVDVELHEPVLGVVAPHVSHRQIDQKVIVRLSPLQVGLAVGNILHEFRSISPNTIRRTHIHRGIKFPSRPWVVLGRIGRAMEEHVVHAGAEHQVHVGLHLAQ